ncbi:MAG: hypothetical protein HY089_08180 [Ignavibacteriales bacterium]|nr:hypothetical protein [Ignavibacteriales bacterium]
MERLNAAPTSPVSKASDVFIYRFATEREKGESADQIKTRMKDGLKDRHNVEMILNAVSQDYPSTKIKVASAFLPSLTIEECECLVDATPKKLKNWSTVISCI